jgi:uncharacterized repeat protein (TIGR03803 family)
MKETRFCTKYFTFLSWLAVAVVCVSPAWGSSENVIYSFAGGGDGALPTSNLIADKAGNLYGTTSEGGNSSACGPLGGESCGVVFELMPSDGAWNESVLYSFTGGTDGGTPYGGLVIDANGNLYGTTYAGGTSGQGTVFEVMPSGGTWTEVVLHSFAGGSDGAFPRAGLILKGNDLAVNTTLGGNSTNCGIFGGESCGTVFGMVHTSKGWIEEILYTFQGGSDGGVPYGGLVLDNSDNLYGTTTQYGASGFGSVFELSRGKGTWVENTLYSFRGGSDGSYPEGTLIFDPAGNLYGTTSARGGSLVGTVFQLEKNQGSWTLNTLHTFSDNGDGAVPEAGLVRRGSSIFGTTYGGGTYSLCGIFGGSPCGTVYELSSSKQGVTYSVVYSFMGMPDAAQPEDSLWVDASGKLYGTGFTGGASGNGAVFEITL